MRLSPKLQVRLTTGFALLLAFGWAAREVTHAREFADVLSSKTINLADVKMAEYKDAGKAVGSAGAYLAGDTPTSTKFVTGRFVLNPGETPHAPHQHAEEEVMIIESGTGDILCDGKTTKVSPGSVMYTTPNAPHGIVNTGKDPIVFYFIKWAAKGH